MNDSVAVANGQIIANRKIGKHKFVELGRNDEGLLEVSLYSTANGSDESPWDEGAAYDYDRYQYEDPNEAIAAYVAACLNDHDTIYTVPARR